MSDLIFARQRHNDTRPNPNSVFVMPLELYEQEEAQNKKRCLMILPLSLFVPAKIPFLPYYLLDSIFFEEIAFAVCTIVCCVAIFLCVLLMRKANRLPYNLGKVSKTTIEGIITEDEAIELVTTANDGVTVLADLSKFKNRFLQYKKSPPNRDQALAKMAQEIHDFKKETLEQGVTDSPPKHFAL